MEETVFSWQRFAEAALAALLALASALYVAYDARWRDKRAAAFAVLGELKTFEVFAESMATLQSRYLEEAQRIETRWERRLSAGMKLSHHDYVPLAQWLRNTVAIRPKLSPLFHQSSARIMDVDTMLWAHLQVFVQAVEAAERLLDFAQRKVDDELSRFSNQSGFQRLRPHFDFGSFNPDQLQLAAKHAAFARQHIGEVLLDRWAFHHRMLRKQWAPEEREAREIKEGLRESMNTNGKPSGNT